MVTETRLSQSALSDIDAILARSHREFGEAARVQYESLIAAAIRHAAQSQGNMLFKPRAELDAGVVSWRLANSVMRSAGGRVKTPRHLLLCRWEGEVLAIARVLHERQDPTRHFDANADWE